MTDQTATLALRLRVTFFDNAIAELEREAQACLAAYPHEPVARAYLVRALYREGRFAEARSLLVERPCDHVEMQIARADYHDYVGEADEARRWYEAALNTDDGHPDALLGLAGVHLTREELRPADGLARRAVALIPREDKCQTARLRVVQGGIAGLKACRGSLFEKLRWGPGVLHAFEQARALCPRSPYPHYALGRYYALAPAALGGNCRRAIGRFRLALQLDPYMHLARLALIVALEHAGHQAEARAERSDYRRRFRDLPAALNALALAR